MKTFKKLDIVIIISLVFLSFTPNIIFSINQSKNYHSTYAIIKVSGKIYDNIDLSSDIDDSEFVVETKHGNNTVSIENGVIQIKEADCHDELCVKQGSISKVGQSIICLPNELIIEIKGDESNNKDDMLLSH